MIVPSMLNASFNRFNRQRQFPHGGAGTVYSPWRHTLTWGSRTSLAFPRKFTMKFTRNFHEISRELLQLVGYGVSWSYQACWMLLLTISIAGAIFTWWRRLAVCPWNHALVLRYVPATFNFRTSLRISTKYLRNRPGIASTRRIWSLMIMISMPNASSNRFGCQRLIPHGSAGTRGIFLKAYTSARIKEFH